MIDRWANIARRSLERAGWVSIDLIGAGSLPNTSPQALMTNYELIKLKKLVSQNYRNMCN